LERRVKEVMSSFDIGVIVREVAPLLTGRFLDNVYQLSSHTLLLSFQGIQERLLLEAGRRIHLTAFQQPVPKTPSGFCRVLRKYLRRKRLDEVGQIGFERIVKLGFSSKDEAYTLYTELFSRGNHILVDGSGLILHALSYRRMRDRDVMRGTPLELPPSTRKILLEAVRSDLDALSSTRGPLSRQLTRLYAIGSFYAEEIVLRAGLANDVNCEALTPSQIDAVHEAIRSITADYRQRVDPRIVVDDDGAYVDVVPLALRRFTGNQYTAFPTFNRAVDEYYAKSGTRRVEDGIEQRYAARVAEQQRILSDQKGQIASLEERIATDQRVGDLIHANAIQFRAIIDHVMQARRSGHPWGQILASVDRVLSFPPLRSIDPDRALAVMELDGTRFHLDLRRDVYANAASFYQRSKDARSKLAGLLKAIEDTTRRIERLQRTKLPPDEVATRPRRVRTKEWYEKFHWFHSSDTLLVLGGRDATTNELLLRRHTDSMDVVLHADTPGSPFAVIKTEGREPSPETLREAAQMVVSYSKVWRSGASAMDAYWIRPEQVSKTPPSGEYLARGSFMIHGQRHYLRKVPLRLAVGIKLTSDRPVVVGGPPTAVRTQTPFYQEIVPGRLKAGELIRRIVARLIGKVPEDAKREISVLPTDEFQVFIPGGRGQLAR
jgi:predicted ribosome quality control (RQC) complex YloA/Tae2 family protein